jgi:hypothetical protein
MGNAPRGIPAAIAFAVTAAVALPAAAQTIPVRKPGLWESQLSGTGPEAEQMKQKMAQMTPQQRAQMEEMMKRTGIGFTADGAMIMRYCLTPEEASMDSGKKLLGKMEREMAESKCEEKEFNRSAREIRFHTVCRTPEGVSDFSGRVFDITPTSMAMEMTARMAGKGEQHMTQKARWISDSCGNLK